MGADFSTEWVPPTQSPQPGQGPWCDLNFDSWWVVADSPSEALAAIEAVDAEVFPIYFGWRAIVERVCIRWATAEEWDDETEIMECRYSTDEGAVEAWRIRVENA